LCDCTSPFGNAEGFLAMSEQPWMRQPSETGKAFDAFLSYLFMLPSERTVVAAWETSFTEKPRKNHEKPRKPKRAAPQWEVWAAKFKWSERANAYDDHQASLLFFHQEEAQRQIAVKRVQDQEKFLENQQRIANQFLKRIEQMLEFPLADQMLERQHPDGKPHVTIVKAAGWNFGTIAKLAVVHDRIGRAALGMPASNQVEISDVAGLAVDRVLAAAKVSLTEEDYGGLLAELARQNRGSGV
jgi:hypothetical protein